MPGCVITLHIRCSQRIVRLLPNPLAHQDTKYLITVNTYLYFWGSKITADGDCSHEIKRWLLLGRKDMTKLDSIFKSRDTILPTKVHLVEAMVFPVVMYGCELDYKES